jgi:hypothetical protein
MNITQKNAVNIPEGDNAQGINILLLKRAIQDTIWEIDPKASEVYVVKVSNRTSYIYVLDNKIGNKPYTRITVEFTK